MRYIVFMSTTPLSFRTDIENVARLDAIAEAFSRNRNWVINEAIEAYLELHQWQVEHIKKGIAATDTLSTDEVRSQMMKHDARRKSGK